jgi:hypothetical protein
MGWWIRPPHDSANEGATDGEEPNMTKYMLLTSHDGGGAPPMTEWKPDEVTAHFDWLQAINRELVENGELVDAQALAGLEQAKVVRSDGGAPVLTDGPFAEYKELLAGYQMVDVDSEARAVEIAARVSAAPGPGGRPLQQPIEVRQVMATELADWTGLADDARPGADV